MWSREKRITVGLDVHGTSTPICFGRYAWATVLDKTCRRRVTCSYQRNQTKQPTNHAMSWYCWWCSAGNTRFARALPVLSIASWRIKKHHQSCWFHWLRLSICWLSTVRINNIGSDETGRHLRAQQGVISFLGTHNSRYTMVMRTVPASTRFYTWGTDYGAASWPRNSYWFHYGEGTLGTGRYPSVQPGENRCARNSSRLNLVFSMAGSAEGKLKKESYNG